MALMLSFGPSYQQNGKIANDIDKLNEIPDEEVEAQTRKISINQNDLKSI